jgi:hypothetical protein
LISINERPGRITYYAKTGGNFEEKLVGYKFVGANDTYAGNAVASARDFDGDGKDDLLIAAYLGNTAGYKAGEVYLVASADLVSADLADGTEDGVITLANVGEQPNSYLLTGMNEGDFAGSSVASAGDTDGDGKPDFVVGAYQADDFVGKAYLLTTANLSSADAADGRVDGTINLGFVASQSTFYEFVGTNKFSLTGVSVSSAGDVDGDGNDDLIIGASGAGTDIFGEGEAYIIVAADMAAADISDGKADGIIELRNIAGQPGSFQFSGTLESELGFSVASVGDVDGDGKDDLLLGAPFALDDFYQERAGAAYLIAASDLAAADREDGNSDGVVSVESIAAQPNSYQFKVAAPDGQFRIGSSVSSAGDVDGDGKADLIIGAPNAGTYYNLGEAYLLTSVDLRAADVADGVVDGEIDLENVSKQPGSYRFTGDGRAQAGNSVGSAGDVDADGKDDLIIGAYYSDIGGDRSGVAHLIAAADLLSADRADGDQDGVIKLENVAAQPSSYILVGIDETDYAGTSVSTAGDVDGDGRADLLIGADGADFHTGEAYLLTAAELDSADRADGQADGVINLKHAAYVNFGFEDLFTGTEAADVYDSGKGRDTLWGLGGDDTLSGGIDSDIIDGGAGADLLLGGFGDDRLSGGFGNDTLAGEDDNDLLFGNSGTDSLLGGAGNDFLSGYTGNDALAGGYGNDELIGGEDNDALYGNSGNDYLSGGDGTDYLSGYTGNDTLNGGLQSDTLTGFEGDDMLYGNSGDDLLDGRAGDDWLSGYTGDDTLVGGLGDDVLLGGDGNDQLLGDAGWDYLSGGTGDDLMLGGIAPDRMVGGDGNDTLHGEEGNDVLEGGNGSDHFVFEDGFGKDRVLDFDPLIPGEVIDLSGVTAITDYTDLVENHLTSGASAMIFDGAANTIELTGLANSDLSPENFVFL